MEGLSNIPRRVPAYRDHQTASPLFGLSLDELEELINNISLGVLVVNRQFELVHGNVTGQQLVDSGKFLQLKDSRLEALEPSQSIQFEEFIEQCFDASVRPDTNHHNSPSVVTCLLRSAGNNGSGKCLLWWRRPKPALRAVSSAISKPGMPDTISILAALPDPLSVSPVGGTDNEIVSNEHIGKTIKTIYGLSEKERELACALVAGSTVDAIAAAKCRSIHTIRNQLKSLFKKTDTHRQADLVRLLTRISTLVGPVDVSAR